VLLLCRAVAEVFFFICIVQRYYHPKILSSKDTEINPLICWQWAAASPKTTCNDQVVRNLTSKMANVNRRHSFSNHRNLAARENDKGQTRQALATMRQIQTTNFIYLNVMRTDIEPFVPVEWTFQSVHFVHRDHPKV
jgi:hypothetical protein